MNISTRAVMNVVWGLTLGLSCASKAMAQQERVRPLQQIVIEDSRGKTVGRSFGGIGTEVIESFGGADLEVRALVLLQIDKTIVPVSVNRERFYGGRVLWFELEDCNGPAWLPPIQHAAEAPSLIPQAAVGIPGQTLYIPSMGVAARTIRIRSILEQSTTCRNTDAPNVTATPAQPLVDLLTVFTPPFSLKAQ